MAIHLVHMLAQSTKGDCDIHEAPRIIAYAQRLESPCFAVFLPPLNFGLDNLRARHLPGDDTVQSRQGDRIALIGSSVRGRHEHVQRLPLLALLLW
ncbi:hypothetical protein [Stenotrophomonas sp. ESTM1D_MKCIP4_1]|uniref:hypothetical protein n=1 Tax=Stenotrophomonas sp. ESTM1D_MKCIP4_1 TaxID=2072414 RepID=UPI00131F141E|nr:hypothetical protein [Stenotrophomonas sp. ESTM1D_MKCIP4_1]